MPEKAVREGEEEEEEEKEEEEEGEESSEDDTFHFDWSHVVQDGAKLHKEEGKSHLV